MDLYDGSLMVDLKSGRVTLCDLDVYERAPMTNRQGRMWGSTRCMAPEEYELGAVIDEVTARCFWTIAMSLAFLPRL